MQLIYDFGANNGDDIPYYLMKSDRVIAVEANPALCERISRRFSTDVALGRLIVENCAVIGQPNTTSSEFYLHRTNDVLSQVGRPEAPDDFYCISVPAKTASEIIDSYGRPLYVKIDVEGQDKTILRDLFTNNFRPAYISAESHTIEVFALLVALGGYNSFKLVDGASVCEKYKNHPVAISNGAVKSVSFPYHAAGPFGNDIPGDWMTADNFVKYLSLEGLGWKDIHASNRDQANGSALVGLRRYITKAIGRKLRLRK